MHDCHENHVQFENCMKNGIMKWPIIDGVCKDIVKKQVLILGKKSKSI